MKDFKIYFIVASVLLGVYLIAEYNKPSPPNWSPTLYYGDKIPLGTYALFHQLNDVFPAAKVIKTDTPFYSVFKLLDAKPGNYLVIAKQISLSKSEFKDLVSSLKKGNSVFMSSFAFNDFLADTLGLNMAFEFQKKSNAGLNFTSKYLARPLAYQFKRDITNQYFSDFDTAKAEVLGMNTYGHCTFLRFKFGKGSLYLCANPAVFTNYSLLWTDGWGYAEKALSYLPASKYVYWDEYQNGDIPIDESPMRVFFSNPSLTWAYYLSLFGLLIFVIYAIKRRQRIIPVIAPLKNATVDFVSVVGQVYFEQRNNTDIARKKVIYLLERLREGYNLKAAKLDDEFAESLSKKLNIDQTFAKKLVKFLSYIDTQTNISDRDLIELNNLIEKLYTQIT